MTLVYTRSPAPCSQGRVPREGAQLGLALYVTLALSVLSASFVVQPVRERASGSRHVQARGRGVGPWGLWEVSELRERVAQGAE